MAKVEMKELFELGQKCSPSPGEPDGAGPVINAQQSRGLGNADAAGSAGALRDGWFLQEDRTPGYGEAMGE